jgi:hypothetical protein
MASLETRAWSVPHNSCRRAGVSARVWALAERTVWHTRLSQVAVCGAGAVSAAPSSPLVSSATASPCGKQLARLVKQHRRQLDGALKCGFASNDSSPQLLEHERALISSLRQLQQLYEVPLEGTIAGNGKGRTTCSPGVLPPTAMPVLGQQMFHAGQLVPPALEDEEGFDIAALQPQNYEVPGRVLVCQGSKCQVGGVPSRWLACAIEHRWIVVVCRLVQTR